MSKAAAFNRRINVEVTEADIAKAHVNNSYQCVVAQAVARTVKDATRVEVDTQAVRFSRGSERYVYLTPYAVQGYIVAYDAGEPIEPFSFQLRKPLLTKHRVRTAEGRRADAARTRARKDATKRGAAKGPGKGESPAVAAKAAYIAAKAAHPGPLSARVGEGRTLPPPRVFKTKHRSYGHRLLRINRAAAAAAAAPAAE